MDTGPLIALAFGVFIIVLAIVLTMLTRRGRRNGPRDGRSAATWEGIRQARNIDPDDPN